MRKVIILTSILYALNIANSMAYVKNLCVELKDCREGCAKHPSGGYRTGVPSTDASFSCGPGLTACKCSGGSPL